MRFGRKRQRRTPERPLRQLTDDGLQRAEKLVVGTQMRSNGCLVISDLLEPEGRGYPLGQPRLSNRERPDELLEVPIGYQLLEMLQQGREGRRDLESRLLG